MNRVILALLLGCSSDNPDHHYHLVIASDFSPDQQQAIYDAASDWQTSTNGYVTFDGAPSPNDVIHFYTATPSQIAFEFGGGYIGYDQTSGQSSTISLLTSLDAQTFHQTALHEIGHALGLVHTPPGTIMCADSACATLIVTCGDQKQLMHTTLPGCFP